MRGTIWTCRVQCLTARGCMQATLTMYGGMLLPYYLHEETGWSLDINELRSQTYKVPNFKTFNMPAAPCLLCNFSMSVLLSTARSSIAQQACLDTRQAVLVGSHSRAGTVCAVLQPMIL